jgi:hypothetical protein
MGALSRLHRRATLEPRGWCTNWTVLETCPLVDGRVCSTLAVATRSFDATDTGSAGIDDRRDRFQQRTTSCRQTLPLVTRCGTRHDVIPGIPEESWSNGTATRPRRRHIRQLKGERRHDQVDGQSLDEVRNAMIRVSLLP